jgi:hypothetical protein
MCAESRLVLSCVRRATDPAGGGPLRRWWRRLPLIIGASTCVRTVLATTSLTRDSSRFYLSAPAVHRTRPVLFNEHALCLFAPSSFEKEAWHVALSRACAPSLPSPASSSLPSEPLAASYAAFLRDAEAAMRASGDARPPGWLACLNLVSARVFFDLQRNERVADALAARLQTQLSRLDTPPFMGRLRVVALTLPPGGAPPRASRLALCDADGDAHPALRGAAAHRGPIPAYEARPHACMHLHP